MGALDGKIAIVTGAGQGLGRHHALLLAANGAQVVVNDLGDAADAVVAEITAGGGAAVACKGSVADFAVGEALVRTAIDTFGDLHVVVNNAGNMRNAMSFSMTEEQFRSVVDVHLTDHFTVSRAAAAHWRAESKAGRVVPRRIINTASESGIFGGPSQANYGAAKGGIVALTMILARELENYGVNVNAIAPRARTPMTEENPRFAAPETGFDRYDPANVSPLVGWLASDAAADVSGQIFVVFGAKVWRLRPAELVEMVDAGDQPWTIETLSAAAPGLFTSSGSGVPPWGAPPLID